MTISLRFFWFLLMLPVLTMGIGMWLMGLVSAPGRGERNACSNEKESTSPLEKRGILSERPWGQAPGRIQAHWGGTER